MFGAGAMVLYAHHFLGLLVAQRAAGYLIINRVLCCVACQDLCMAVHVQGLWSRNAGML